MKPTRRRNETTYRIPDLSDSSDHRCGATQRSCRLRLAQSHLRRSQARLEHCRGSFHRFHFLEESEHCTGRSEQIVLDLRYPHLDCSWCSATPDTVHREMYRLSLYTPIICFYISL